MAAFRFKLHHIGRSRILVRPSSLGVDKLATFNCRIACGVSAIATALLVQSVSAGDLVNFAPHRAVYEVSLTNSAAGSGVVDMSGRMVYELGGSSCEGYTQNMRFVTRSSNQDGADTINDLRTSSWEEAAGKRLRFSSTQYQNDEVAEASQGDASRAKGSDVVAVDLVKPGKKHLSLPGDIYLPMQHAAMLIQSAKMGKTMVTAKLYDGAEKGDKYYSTTAVIGKKLAPGATKNVAAFKDASRLDGVASWPISISYFETGKDKTDSLPAYELSFRYYENGVTTDLKIDYGEFAIKGQLKELTFHDGSKCSSATP
jgi:EipB-like